MKKLLTLLFFALSLTICFAQTAEEYVDSGVKKAQLNDNTGAVAEFTKAIEINPLYARAFSGRAFAKYSLSDFNGALADFNKAIEIDPTFSEDYRYRARLKVNLNDLSGAIADLTKAIEINPNGIDLYFERGYIKQRKLNDYNGAIVDYDKVIALNPQHVEAYLYRGVCNGMLNQHFDACLDLSMASKLGNETAKEAMKTLCNFE